MLAPSPPCFYTFTRFALYLIPLALFASTHLYGALYALGECGRGYDINGGCTAAIVLPQVFMLVLSFYVIDVCANAQKRLDLELETAAKVVETLDPYRVVRWLYPGTFVLALGYTATWILLMEAPPLAGLVSWSVWSVYATWFAETATVWETHN
jgi:hypothetical protein